MRARAKTLHIDEDTLAILSALEYPNQHHARIVEQVGHRAYRRVNSVLEALGGSWSRADRAHVFTGDARELIDQAITTGEVLAEVSPDAQLGHYPTPEPLARELVRMANVQRGNHVLEPSAGDGAIVLALQDAGAIVTCVERAPLRREKLLVRVLKSRDVLAQAIDFMMFEHGRPFDAIVMNPPFCRSGQGDHLDHVRHAHRMLRPGGVLVSVMPSSLTFRRDRRYAETRAWCEARGEISPLPAGSFSASGTEVNTVVVRLRADRGAA